MIQCTTYENDYLDTLCGAGPFGFVSSVWWGGVYSLPFFSAAETN